MTQSGTDTEENQDTLPGDWSQLSVDDEDIHRRWESPELEMAVEIYEVDNREIYSVEALQDVETMGYTSTVMSHFESTTDLDEAVEFAHSFIEDTVDGKHSVEALCAFESEEMVDFVCVYVDDVDDVDDLEQYREIVKQQLGDVDESDVGTDIMRKDLPESEAENITFDVFPQSKPNVDVVGGDDG